MSTTPETSRLALDTLSGGAVLGQLSAALDAVAENIADVATEATAKRTVTIVLEITPDEDRALGKLKATVSAKLAPDRPTETRVELTARGMFEYVPPQLHLPLAGVHDLRAALGRGGKDGSL